MDLLTPLKTALPHSYVYSGEDEYRERCTNNVLAEVQAVAEKTGKLVIIDETNTDEFKHHLIKYGRGDDATICVHPITPDDLLDDSPDPTYDLGYIGTYIHQLKAIRTCRLPSFVTRKGATKGKYKSATVDPDIHLNESQREVVTGLCSSLELVQGPPGTGKSTTIYHIIRNRFDGKTLVTSKNNQAIAAVCDKLKQHHSSVFEEGNFHIVVLGNILRVSDLCKPYHIDTMVETQLRKTQELVALRLELTGMEGDLKEVQKQKDVEKEPKKLKGLTSFCDFLTSVIEKRSIKLQSQTEMFRTKYSDRIMRRSNVCLCTIASAWRVRHVDNIIIDEAATIEEESMPLLFKLKPSNYVLVGDHMQLGPFTHVNGFRPMSFFERMVENGHSVKKLTIQYRMAHSIGEMVSKVFYGGDLIHGVDREEDVLKWKTHKSHEELEDTSYYNAYEIKTVCRLVREYNDKYPTKSVMVISFYMAQLQRLRKGMGDRNVSVVTVDSCQGMEADAVFVSCVRSNQCKNIGFCKNKNRLCVALSRAKESLVIVGNRQTFKRDRLWKRVIKNM